MSSADANPTTQTLVRYRLPDPPEREPDEVTSYRYVHNPHNSHPVAKHLGNPDTTLFVAEEWIAAYPGFTPLRRPDIMIAFDVDPELFFETGGYVISDQGKPPDFVLEVASRSTFEVDLGPKREEYAALGIPEYWRYDFTGEFYGVGLAGDRLVGDRYEPIEIVEIAPGVLQGASEAIGLWLRWEDGDPQLGWIDPATGEHIPTLDSLQEELEAERAALLAERAARLELEAELRRLREQESAS